MGNKLLKIHQDTKGMALLAVMGIMAILFVLGTAALTTTNMESKISQNYIQSIQALYDCEAGIAEAMARIKEDTLNLDQWEQADNNALFQYRYKVTYKADQCIYVVDSRGKDPTQTAYQRIIAEISSTLLSNDIPSPVYCGTAENRGQPNTINGNSSCPGWADDGDPNNDCSIPCISTSSSYQSDTDPVNFDPNQLITSNPYQIAYNTPEIDLINWVNYYRDSPPDLTSLPDDDEDIGDSNDLKIVYIDGDQSISGNKSGYGVLIVTGELHISGQLNWNGIIIALEKFKITGNGTITGAVLTPNHFDMRGHAHLQWCGDLIRKVLTETGTPSLDIVSWKEY